MKKLITIILILSLFLPAAVLAESAVTGVWIATEKLSTGCPSMTYLYLAEDHTSYFVIQAFKPDGPGLGRQFVGTWEELSSGDIHVVTGNNTSITLSLAGDYAVDDSMTFYCHAPVKTLQEALEEIGYE